MWLVKDHCPPCGVTVVSSKFVFVLPNIVDIAHSLLSHAVPVLSNGSFDSFGVSVLSPVSCFRRLMRRFNHFNCLLVSKADHTSDRHPESCYVWWLNCLAAYVSRTFQIFFCLKTESKLAGSHPAFEVRTFIAFPSSRICSARHAVLNWPSFSIFWSRSSSFCGAALVNRKARVTRHSTFCKSCVNPRLMLVDKVEILPSSFPASSVTLSKLLSRFSSTAGSGFLSPCSVSSLLVAAVCRSLHIALFLQALVNKCLKRVLTLWQALCMATDGLGSSQMIWTAESLADLNIPLRVNY